MIKSVMIWAAACVSVAALQCGTVHATSLEIHPTMYRDISLKQGEQKKAYIDVVNPSASKEMIRLNVQAFRQTDDTGALAFYDNEQVAKGVKLDLSDFELGPHEAIRVYFLLDGRLLPTGDVFAAIFARTVPQDGAAVQAVRVGSLLAITNGTPASHTADVSSLVAPFIQIGGAMTAQFSLTNPAHEKEATGFFPRVTVQTWPYGERSVEGPLLLAGRTRTIQYRQPGNYFGFVNLHVSAGGKTASKILLVVTGFWRWLAPLLVAAIMGIGVISKRAGIVPHRLNRRHR